MIREGMWIIFENADHQKTRTFADFYADRGHRNIPNNVQITSNSYSIHHVYVWGQCLKKNGKDPNSNPIQVTNCITNNTTTPLPNKNHCKGWGEGGGGCICDSYRITVSYTLHLICGQSFQVCEGNM
jgi:hypothetical protein